VERKGFDSYGEGSLSSISAAALSQNSPLLWGLEMLSTNVPTTRLLARSLWTQGITRVEGRHHVFHLVC
jgi:hypothetical protein